MTATSGGGRTLLIGIDAASPDVLEGMSAAGATPTIDILLEEGTSGPLQSQLPPWTASAWPSLYTGVNPGKHGVYDFLRFEGYDWDVVNRTAVREHAIWELLDRHGLSSVVVNVPVTHPARPFDGALVPGYVAPESASGYPDGVMDEVRSAIGGYQIYNPAARDAPRDERVDGFLELTRMRGEAFRHLADRIEPEFGFLQFQQTDTVFHEFPDHERSVRSVFEAVDHEIGESMASFDPDTVVIASDHGIAPYDGIEFRVNEHLRREGYVETTTRGEGMPSWSSIARTRLREGGSGAPGLSLSSLAASGLSAAAAVGLTSQRLAAVLDRLGLTRVVAAVVPTDVIRAGTAQVDFPASTAYMRSRVEMGVRINVAGREPSGTVPPEDYHEVRDDLVESLTHAVAPDGQPVFESVRPREAVFEGPHIEAAADVIVVPNGYAHRLTTSMLGETIGPLDGIWEHVPEGFVGIAGAGVNPDASMAGAHLFDVAPTVLALFGIPAGERMDGSVLAPVEPAGRTAYPEFNPEELAATADAQVERRLADLGYLE